MRIGIDISQLVYPGTGVGNYLEQFVLSLLKIDTKNEYVLFFSSFRKTITPEIDSFRDDYRNVRIKCWKFPPVLLDIFWNRLHIVPIEWLIGDVDIFISSDWTQPPTIRAKKATILYDLIVYKFPSETDNLIVETQKRRLVWVKKECQVVFCISEATKKDALDILQVDKEKLKVILPGIPLNFQATHN